jgi:homoserine O-succinyltransferase
MARRGDLVIGLINNMPDTAVAATERQFRNLLASAAAPTKVKLRLFSLASVARGPEGTRYLRQSDYAGIADLVREPPDALIFTGTEPINADFRNEPYWCELTSAFDWAEETGCPAVLSCLAAHAAMLHFDGIRRVPLGAKCFGVFDHLVVSAHPITRGLPPRLAVPHSRWNGIAEADLARSGYNVLIDAPGIGAHCMVRQGRAAFLLLQGHPEYEAATLAREFRRDVARYLNGDLATYPALPRNYFDLETIGHLERLERRARNARDTSLLADFPAVGILKDRFDSWRAPARTLFRNWLDTVKCLIPAFDGAVFGRNERLY